MEITPEFIEKSINEVVPFIGRMGMKVEGLSRGYVKLRVPLEGNGNHFGAMYAGALFTTGEVPVGAIWFTTWDLNKYIPIVKEMNIQFKRPAMTDVTIEVRMPDEEATRIEKETDANGKCEFQVSSEIKDANGEIVAVCLGTYQLRKQAG